MWNKFKYILLVEQLFNYIILWDNIEQFYKYLSMNIKAKP